MQDFNKDLNLYRSRRFFCVILLSEQTGVSEEPCLNYRPGGHLVNPDRSVKLAP